MHLINLCGKQMIYGPNNNLNQAILLQNMLNEPVQRSTGARHLEIEELLARDLEKLLVKENKTKMDNTQCQHRSLRLHIRLNRQRPVHARAEMRLLYGVLRLPQRYVLEIVGGINS